jgi:hypothetical protein
VLLGRVHWDLFSRKLRLSQKDNNDKKKTINTLNSSSYFVETKIRFQIDTRRRNISKVRRQHPYVSDLQEAGLLNVSRADCPRPQLEK